MGKAKHLTPEELAERVGVKPCTLAMWRVRGTGPRFIKFGTSQQARVRYSEAEVEAWERAHEQTNTGASNSNATPQ
jgi:predicted site-specific integrase-resolvase